MEYRKLGRSGVLVSPLCLGTMNFGGSTEEGDSFAIMQKAVEGGINFFDTANVYNQGESERITGKFLKEKNLREQVVLATKVYSRVGELPNEAGGTRYHIVRACEDSLRRLSRRKARELRLPAKRRRVPRDNNGSLPRFDHRWRQSPGQIQKRHRVDLEVLIQHRGVHLEERAEGAAHGVVDEDRWRAELGTHSFDRGVELRLVGHVAGIATRVFDLALERGQSLPVPGEHRHRVATAGESASHRGSGARAYAGDQRDGTVLFHGLLLSVRRPRPLRSRSAKNQSRSLPQPRWFLSVTLVIKVGES